MKFIIFSLALCFSFVSSSAIGGELKPSVQFYCDGSASETAWLCEDHSSFLDLSCPGEGPFRVTDAGRYMVYRFDLPGVTQAKARLRIGNSYKISLSTDGKAFTPVLQSGKTIGGLKNLAVHTVDLTPFIEKSSTLWMMSADFNSADGFGGCLFEVTILTDRQPTKTPLLSSRRCSKVLKLDGMLDEEDWQQAQWASNFTLFGQMAPVSQETRAALLYDDEFLYVGFDCLDAKMDQVESLVTQRDGDIYRDNAVEFFIAPDVDNPAYYHFATNTLGVQFDEAMGEGTSGISWNPQWKSVVKKFGDRWQAELAIPWKSLGVSPCVNKVLAVNFTRTEGPHQEISSWIPLEGSFHQRDRFGRTMLTDKSPLVSFTADVRSLMQNPPMFEPLSILGLNNKNWYSCVRLFRANKFNSSQSPILTAWRGKRDVEKNIPVSEKTLNAGKYIAEIEWKSNGQTLYMNQIGITILDEDRRAWMVTLDQPFYTVEQEFGFEYRRRKSDKEEYLWEVLSAENLVICKGKAILSGRTGRVVLPMFALDSGKYTFAIEPSMEKSKEKKLSLSFEKGTVLGTPTVYKIDKRGRWVKNGKLFIPMVMYLPADLKELSEIGFNVVVTGIDNPVSIKSNIDLLNKVDDSGLGLWLHVCNLFRGKEDYDSLRSIVSRLKTHPGLAGWYLADEPSGTATSPKVLRRAADIIRQIDPNHPVVGCDNMAVMFGAYAPVFDGFMSDPYPVPHGNIDMVTRWITSSDKALPPEKSLIVCLQAQGQPFYPRGPNKEEIWNMAYQSVAAGVRGIAWWAHGPARSSAEWPEYSTLVPNLKKLMSYTVSSKARRSFGENGIYAAVFDGPKGRVLVAVNTGDSEGMLKIPVKAETIVDLGVIRSATASKLPDGIKLQISKLGFGAWQLQ